MTRRRGFLGPGPRPRPPDAPRPRELPLFPSSATTRLEQESAQGQNPDGTADPLDPRPAELSALALGSAGHPGWP